MENKIINMDTSPASEADPANQRQQQQQRFESANDFLEICDSAGCPAAQYRNGGPAVTKAVCIGKMYNVPYALRQV